MLFTSHVSGFNGKDYWCQNLVQILYESLHSSLYSLHILSHFYRKITLFQLEIYIPKCHITAWISPLLTAFNVSHKSGETFLLFLQFCVITLVCTSKQCRAIELFMTYTTRHTVIVKTGLHGGEGIALKYPPCSMIFYRTSEAGGLLIKQSSYLLIILI